MQFWFKYFVKEKKDYYWVTATTTEEALKKANQQAARFKLTFDRIEATGEKMKTTKRFTTVGDSLFKLKQIKHEQENKNEITKVEVKNE